MAPLGGLYWYPLSPGYILMPQNARESPLKIGTNFSAFFRNTILLYQAWVEVNLSK